jgi:hypothetical protein
MVLLIVLYVLQGFIVLGEIFWVVLLVNIFSECEPQAFQTVKHVHPGFIVIVQSTVELLYLLLALHLPIILMVEDQVFQVVSPVQLELGALFLEIHIMIVYFNVH